MEETTNLFLQFLLLKDLLRTNTIDMDIYNRAVQKLEAIKNEKQAA